MILSQGKYPFGTIITRMSDGDVQFVISTAKEGLLKGLTTCVQLPTGTTAAKVFYMPSMNKPAIHAIHNMLVESIEENLKAGGHLAIVIHDLLLSLRDSQYTQEVVIDCNLADYVTSLRGDAKQPPEGETAAEQSDFFAQTVLAAKMGIAEAQFALGLCYHNGGGVAKDDMEAVKWFRKAAEQSHADAQYNLGVCYRDGQGVAQDDAEAVKWWLKAAEQGSASAQFNLGVRYREGKGVAKNEAEAAKWYRKAAEQGDTEAQYNLGLCYAKGSGVAQDAAEVVKWWRKAAEQGHATAQKLLDAGAGG